MTHTEDAETNGNNGLHQDISHSKNTYGLTFAQVVDLLVSELHPLLPGELSINEAFAFAGTEATEAFLNSSETTVVNAAVRRWYAKTDYDLTLCNLWTDGQFGLIRPWDSRIVRYVKGTPVNWKRKVDWQIPRSDVTKIAQEVWRITITLDSEQTEQKATEPAIELPPTFPDNEHLALENKVSSQKQVTHRDDILEREKFCLTKAIQRLEEKPTLRKSEISVFVSDQLKKNTTLPFANPKRVRSILFDEPNAPLHGKKFDDALSKAKTIYQEKIARENQQ